MQYLGTFLTLDQARQEVIYSALPSTAIGDPSHPLAGHLHIRRLRQPPTVVLQSFHIVLARRPRLPRLWLLAMMTHSP
jgi:hypothetical protein